MALPLGGGEPPAHLFPLAAGGQVGKGDVQLAALHVHVNANHPLPFGQLLAGLDGVVKEVAQNHAQIQVRDGQLHRDVGVRPHGDALGLGQGNLAV